MAPANTPLLTHSNVVSATSVDLSRIYYHEKISGKHQGEEAKCRSGRASCQRRGPEPCDRDYRAHSLAPPRARTRQPTLGTDSGSAIQPLGT